MNGTYFGTLRTLAALTSLFALLAVAGCAPAHCRYDPGCGGGVGATCDNDSQCATGWCCDSGNCGGGMCTYSCRDDLDCPSDMLCEHDTCFFNCASDEDCAVGMSCEHGQTICEWP